MARRKSYREIGDQTNRLLYELGTRRMPNRVFTARMNRVMGASSRYQSNIMNSQEYNDVFNRVYGQNFRPREGMNRQRANDAALYAADRVQIPRRVYMGLNNG